MGGEHQLHLRDIVAVLLVHWKIVAFVTVLVAVAAYSSAKRAVPSYRSDSAFQVRSKKQAMARMDDIDIDELEIKTDPVMSEALILQTQALALDVVDVLGLRLRIADPLIPRGLVLYDVQVDTLARQDSFALAINGPAGYELRAARGGGPIAAGKYDTPVLGPGFSFKVRPYEGKLYTVKFAIIDRDAAGTEVRGGVSFNIQQGTTVVNVSYVGTDWSLAPDILNESMHALREYGADRMREIARQRETYVKNRLDDVSEQYRAALAQLQTYKETQHTTDLSAEEQALITSIQELDHQKEQLQGDLALLQTILGQTRDANITLETLNRLAAMQGVDRNSAITFQMQNLLKLYDDRRSLTAGTLGLKENNPQVQALDQRIQQAGRALREAAQATEQGMQASIAALDTRIKEQRAQLATYPGKETQFGQLQLNAALLNDTYRYLLTQWQSVEISKATIAPYVQIIENATVASRLGLGTRQKTTIGLLVGLFLGVLIAFFLEYLDQTIKSAADVERVLEIPVLGLIPLDPRGLHHGRRDGRRRAAIPLISRAAPDDPTSEAYRALRTNVTFVSAEQHALQLMCVTSPGPGEGKSTTAANLAITLAQQGAHTLLVDADLRRPQVHRAFNLVQEPGLTDILVGTATLREAVRPNVVPSLDVLPGGALPPNPSELLGSEAMHRLLADLRLQYDNIIFDTPPALAVTDATVLGASADGVILVLRAGETEEAAAQRAVETLRRVQARVAGSVLNGVEKQRDRYYQYYNYSSSAHASAGRGPLAAIRQRLARLL